MRPTIIPILVFVFAFGVGRIQAADFGYQHHHSDPYSNVSSGMLLGVYAQADGTGLRINSLIPGYSAVGRLQPGDVLLRMTADGWNVYDLYSMAAMEQAKSITGPNREAAIEFYRPGVGLTYAWVTFTPIAGPAFAPTATKQFSAQFRLESEKPGSRAMFDKKPRKNQLPSSWNIPHRNGNTGIVPPHLNHSGTVHTQPFPFPQTSFPQSSVPRATKPGASFGGNNQWDNGRYNGHDDNNPMTNNQRVPQLSSPSDLFGRR